MEIFVHALYIHWLYAVMLLEQFDFTCYEKNEINAVLVTVVTLSMMA
jgi:hypothetical protein